MSVVSLLLSRLSMSFKLSSRYCINMIAPILKGVQPWRRKRKSTVRNVSGVPNLRTAGSAYRHAARFGIPFGPEQFVLGVASNGRQPNALAAKSFRRTKLGITIAIPTGWSKNTRRQKRNTLHSRNRLVADFRTTPKRSLISAETPRRKNAAPVVHRLRPRCYSAYA